MAASAIPVVCADCMRRTSSVSHSGHPFESSGMYRLSQSSGWLRGLQRAQRFSPRKFSTKTLVKGAGKCSRLQSAKCNEAIVKLPETLRTTLAPLAAACTSWRAVLGSPKRAGSFIWRESSLLTSQFTGVAIPVNLTSPCATQSFSSTPVISADPPLIRKVSARELTEILTKERTSPLVIDFYATWCGPCILLAQELEMLAVEFGEDILFLKVDTDEEHELASQMEIRGLPTMVFVSKDADKLAIRTEGLLPKSAIRDIIEKELLAP